MYLEGQGLWDQANEAPGAELEDLASEVWSGMSVVDLEGEVSMMIMVSLSSDYGFKLL